MEKKRQRLYDVIRQAYDYPENQKISSYHSYFYRLPIN